MIIAVIYATFAVAKRKPEKKFRLVWDSNPCHLSCHDHIEYPCINKHYD